MRVLGVLPLGPLPRHGRRRPARADRLVGDAGGAGARDVDGPARHAGHVGDVPASRAARDQRRRGGRDERWTGRARSGGGLVRGRARRIRAAVPRHEGALRPVRGAAGGHHRAVAHAGRGAVLVRRRPLHGHRLTGPAQADGAGRAADHRRRPRQAPDPAAGRHVCGGVQRRLLVGARRRGAVRPGPRGVRHRRPRPGLAGLLRRPDGLLRPRRRGGPSPRGGHRARPPGAAGNGVAGTPAECVETIGRYASVGAERVYLQVLDLADLDHLDLLAAEVMPHV